MIGTILALRRAFVVALGLAVVAGPTQFQAQAQGYPNKVISILVPAAAGGPTDTVARLIAESMTKTLGQTVIVENAGGAGGTIGMAKVARAAPDGYSLAVWHIAQATAPSLYDGLKYDVINDFESIGRITDVPMTIVAKSALPPKDIASFMEWLKANAAKDRKSTRLNSSHT